MKFKKDIVLIEKEAKDPTFKIDLDNIPEELGSGEKEETVKKRREVAMPEAKQEISLVEVPTQTTIAFKLEDGRVVDERALLLELYKDIQSIKKAVC